MQEYNKAMRSEGQEGEIVRGKGKTCGRYSDGQGVEEEKMTGGDSENARSMDEMTKP